MTPDQRYPALLVEWLSPIYDLFVRLFLPEVRFKRALINHARIAPGHRVLDLGAGTGTLAIMINQIQPEAQVIGIDGDPKILSIAQEKASRSGVEISFQPGDASALPYSDASFNRVLSSLVISLLSSTEKTFVIREVYRVLKSSGELHIADFGKPHTRWGRMVAPHVRRFEPIIDNLEGRLPVIFQETGFARVEEAARFATIFGTISILSGQKP